jgi:hypothetical protein
MNPMCLLLVSCILLFACNNQPEPPTTNTPATTPAATNPGKKPLTSEEAKAILAENEGKMAIFIYGVPELSAEAAAVFSTFGGQSMTLCGLSYPGGCQVARHIRGLFSDL